MSTQAVDFNPQDPAFLQDPYPVYRRLRSEAPHFFHEESGFWYFTRHEDVSTLLRDRRLGRSILHVLSPEELALPPAPPENEPFLKLGRHSMFDQEPPDHTRLRSLVHKAFTPARIRALQGSIQAITDSLLDAVQSKGEMDLLEDFAVPLPVTVIAELLGIPQADRPKLRPWSNAIVKMYELNPTPAQTIAAIQASQEFADYLKYLAHQRKQTPQDDLITALVFVEEAGDQLTEDEFVSTCVLLLNAGHEATVNVIGNGFWTLFRHPAQLRQLQANPSLINSAVEELMRYDTPLQLFRRWVLQDFHYQDIFLKKGTEVALLFGAANHDPEVFTDPHRLDLTRDHNPHLSFGGGIHYCLGAPLARMELQIAFASILRRFPNLKVIEAPQFQPTYVIRGLKSLHVAF